MQNAVKLRVTAMTKQQFGKGLLVLLLMFLTWSCGSGGGTNAPVNDAGSVEGTVTDSSTSAALSGATIQIGDKTATTGSNGVYRIQNIDVGTKTVTASKAGYQNHNGTCDVSKDTTVSHNIQLTGDTTPPTLSSTSPANNVTGIAVNSALTATFSEAMDVSTITTSTFTLKQGSTPVSGTVTYTGTTATFTPSSNLSYSTSYTATITTGAKDTAENAIASNYSWSFTTGTAEDTTPPTVSSTSPTNNATDIAINSAITAAFSETMDSSTITTSTFTLKQGTTAIAGTVTYSGTTATFTPSSSLSYSTSYTAAITTGVKDSAGNAMASDYSWTFTTASAGGGGTSGSLDTTFGTGGKVTTATESAFGDYGARDLVIQSDGKVVAAGSSFTGSDNDFTLVRYNTDGTLDSTFGTGGKVTTNFRVPGAYEYGREGVNALDIQSDGKIVAAGYSNNGTYKDVYGMTITNYDYALARYNTDGTLDSSFGTGGKVTTDFATSSSEKVRDLVIQSDGKIVVAGYSDSNYLVRYNTDGTLDSTFGTSGKVTSYSLSNGYQMALLSLEIQSDGKIVAAGGISGDFAVARYNTDGTLDTTFGTGGVVTTNFDWSSGDVVYALGIQSDGKIVAAGHSNNNYALARYNTDGTLDTTFGTGGKKVTTDFGGNTNIAYALVIQSDGKIVAAGDCTGISGSTTITIDFTLVRYNTDGTLDTTFGTGGKVTTDFGGGTDIAYALGIQSDGKIVATGGSITGSGSNVYYSFALVRYLP